MNEKLRLHLTRLLASAKDCDAKNEIMDELMSGLTDKYNDLIAQGVGEDEAYGTVINSIGDVGEIIAFINASSPGKNADFDYGASFGGFEQRLKEIAKELEGPMRSVANDLKSAASGTVEAAKNAKGPFKDMMSGVADSIKNAAKSINFSVNIKGRLDNRYDYVIPSADISSIEVDMRSGDFMLGISEDENIYLVELSSAALDEDKRASVTSADGTLRIAQGASGVSVVFFGYGLIASDFQLFLPKRMWERIIVKTTSGDILSDCELKAAELSFQSTSGDIKLKNADVRLLALKSSSGDIDCENVSCESSNIATISGDIACRAQTGHIEISSTSGDTELFGMNADSAVQTVSGDITLRFDDMPGALRAKSTSGDIKLFIPENDGFAINYNRVSGDLRSDFNLMTSLNERSGTAVYRNGSERVYDISTISGDIKIYKR